MLNYIKLFITSISNLWSLVTILTFIIKWIKKQPDIVNILNRLDKITSHLFSKFLSFTKIKQSADEILSFLENITDSEKKDN